MPQVIAGTASDLTKSVSQLVKELLENNWPTSAFDPLKADVKFGLDTWDDYGDIQVHIGAGRSISKPHTIGWGRSRIDDPAMINLFVRKVQEEIPSTVGSAQRKIEEIIKDNAGTLGQGVQILRWDGWNAMFLDHSLKDIWHAIGSATAIYFKVKT